MSLYKNTKEFENGTSRTIEVFEQGNDIVLCSVTKAKEGELLKTSMTFGEECVYGNIVTSKYKIANTNITAMYFDGTFLRIEGINELNNMKKEEGFNLCEKKAYDIILEKLSEKGKLNIVGLTKKGKQKQTYLSFSMFLLALVFVGGIFCWSSCSNNSSSKWDNLTDEEQQWYEDNYGGGKSDAYDDAIDKYRNK